ncbi:type II toxin-antitoxin system HicB family antitoxin [Synechococcus sp. PCC 7336]|uniref:type II toxin-antitoxin system HicB family antitoxin n=1 Tax=Synechococcus sp. PCC 7336 TaxID=195250 RepID=UPI0003457720|nr:type II toxin-antitoxin system HicB family antitoxin [Synechococcus sp. PCC 7336]
MNRFSYPISLLPEKEGGFVVHFRDLAEAITQGDTVEECLAEASDCLEEAIAARIDDRLNIPEPSELQDSEYLVAVPLQMALKAALYIEIQASGLSNTRLGELLGKDEKEIRRILDPHHGTKLQTLETALLALGKRPELHLQELR